MDVLCIYLIREKSRDEDKIDIGCISRDVHAQVILLRVIGIYVENTFHLAPRSGIQLILRPVLQFRLTTILALASESPLCSLL